jgi:hypothetical protein
MNDDPVTGKTIMATLTKGSELARPADRDDHRPRPADAGTCVG